MLGGVRLLHSIAKDKVTWEHFSEMFHSMYVPLVESEVSLGILGSEADDSDGD